MTEGFHTGWLLLTSVYLLLGVAAALMVVMYRYAWLKMKKTRMIHSVYMLGLALLFDTAYFTVVTVLFGYGAETVEVLILPELVLIPKGLLLIALMYFMNASLCPDRKVCVKHAREIQEVCACYDGGLRMAKTTKEGYYAEFAGKKDLTYWANLWAELQDTWWETKELIVTAWNLSLQIVELVTALIPLVRTIIKKWLDAIRYHW